MYVSMMCDTQTYLGSLDDFSEVVQYGPDIIFQSLVVILQKSLFTLREHSLCGHVLFAMLSFLTEKKKDKHSMNLPVWKFTVFQLLHLTDFYFTRHGCLWV